MNRPLAIVLFLTAFVRIAAQTATTTPTTPSSATAPVVKLEQVTVSEQRAGAEAAFADKAGGDTPTEIISGAALKTPTAQSASDLLKTPQGECEPRADGASRISIRGLDSRFTRITVDGQRQGGTGNAPRQSSARDRAIDRNQQSRDARPGRRRHRRRDQRHDRCSGFQSAARAGPAPDFCEHP